MNEEKTYMVYMHTCPDGLRYVGASSEGYEKRWRKNGYHNSPFGRACKEFGWGNVQHEILFEGLSFEEAQALEEAMIAKFQTMNPEKGYNRDMSRLHRKKNPVRPVLCLDTGVVYPSITKAGTEMNLSPRHIMETCHKKRKHVRGYSFCFADEVKNAD